MRQEFVPSDLGALVGDLVTGAIHVKFKSASKGTRIGDAVAFYDSDDDALFFNFTNAHSSTLQSLVVHEAVHALCDKNKYRMDIGTSESMAYIVQCQFAKLRFPPGGKRLGDGKFDGKDSDAVFAKGWEIADRLFADFEKGELSPFSYQPMRKAVDMHPNYKDKISIPAIYNGLKRRPK